jgi:hypothetical protein
MYLVSKKDLKDLRAQLARALADGNMSVYRDLLEQLSIAVRP